MFLAFFCGNSGGMRFNCIGEALVQTGGLCKRRVQGSEGVSDLNPVIHVEDGAIGVGIGIGKTNTRHPTPDTQGPSLAGPPQLHVRLHLECFH